MLTTLNPVSPSAPTAPACDSPLVGVELWLQQTLPTAVLRQRLLARGIALRVLHADELSSRCRLVGARDVVRAWLLAHYTPHAHEAELILSSGESD